MSTIAANRCQVLELLKVLVRFPSLSREEGPIADFVEDYVRKAGLPVERFEDNVYFWLGDGEDRLLLNSHLDVVPPSKEHPYDPFEPVEVDGQLYGRGTVDAKASGATMTTAVLERAMTKPSSMAISIVQPKTRDSSSITSVVAPI